MDREYAPKSSKVARQVVRGDFGPTHNPSEDYPDWGTFNSLDWIYNDLEDVPECGLVTEGIVDPELREILDGIPESQRCIEAMRFYSNKLLATQATEDRRKVTGPKPGELPSPEYEALTRMQKAKLHLDRARQMYVAGKSILTKGIARKSKFLMSRGKSLQYSTEKNNLQEPRLGKKSAAYELYQGYTLIRDYEMNPPPPLDADGNPNPERVEEDARYQFLMGTFRMTPNRLGLGPKVRAVWRAARILDPNFYDSNEEEEGQPLYKTVFPDEAKGPERVIAVKSWMWDDAKEGGEDSSFVLPDEALLEQLGYPNRAIETDVARALRNVHQNFPPPLVPPDEKEEEEEPRSQPPSPSTSPESSPSKSQKEERGEDDDISLASRPLPALLYPPFALLGQPYPAGTWPFSGVEVLRDYIPPFFPSGLSLRAEGGPPYYQIDPDPLYGAPSNYPIVWDARVALEEMSSYTSRLEESASSAVRTERAQEWVARGREDPDFQPSFLPLTYWPRGKIVDWVGDVSPPQNYIPSLQTYWVNPTSLSNAGLSKTPYSRRFVGLDSRTRTNQTLDNVIENEETLSQARGEDTLFPYGRPINQKPQRVILTAFTKKEQRRMLQHALFLLAAPPNEWQRKHLPEYLLLGDVPLNVPPGTNAPGDGYIGRTNHNLPNSNFVGWRGYLNPFLLAPGIAGRTDATRASRSPTLTTNDVPIGPLDLDPYFGVDVDNLPGEDYEPRVTRRVWVIKTNQNSVLGDNTWGLDFFA